MNYRNFIEVTRQHAEKLASKNAYIFLQNTGRAFAEQTITFSGLDYATRNIASHLQKHRCFNQRVLLLYPSGLEFIKAFLGCLYAGAVAVPATLPLKRGQHSKRVFGIIHDADVAVVMTSKAYIETIKTWLEEEGLNQLPCLATDDLPSDLSNEWVESKIEPGHLAFLQYTSGSTSEPKGVMVTHKNLLCNEKSIKHGFGLSVTTKIGGWLPFYHDMGLIGIVLNSLYLGVPAVLMSPMAFLKRPAQWLQTISDYRITFSGGPNFAYDFCTQRVTDEQLAKLDLSCWEVAFNGSEPIRMETLKAFSDRFAITGFSSKAFYPCYGLAESTLFVSGGPKDKIPTTITVDSSLFEQNEVRVLSTDTESKTRTLVSSGIVQDLNVVIVDPETKERLAENQVGEVWINGDSVAQGYWKLDELTETTFNAKICGEQGLGYFRTGDLGFFNGGELFITGCIKEVIIINGRNLYPYDIEREVQAINLVLSSRDGAAFSVDVGQEELVIVQELKPPLMPEAELKEVALRIKQSIGQSFEVQVHNIVFIKQGSLNKTTSGKIQRKLTKNLFLDNKLDVVFQERSASLRLCETAL